MSDGDASNVIGVRTVYDAVLRLEGKVDASNQRVDEELDRVTGRMDRLEGRLEGSVGMLRWLGPTGIAALVYAMLKGGGYV